MPILHRTATYTEHAFDGFQCDRCKKEYRTPQDAPGVYGKDKVAILTEIQEMFHWHARGGYGSVWGDGADVELTLCQKCAFAVLGEHVVYKDQPGKAGAS